MSDVRFSTLYPELCPLNQTLKDPGNALGTLLKVFTMRLEPCTLKGGHPPKTSASIRVKPRNRTGGWFSGFRVIESQNKSQALSCYLFCDRVNNSTILQFYVYPVPRSTASQHQRLDLYALQEITKKNRVGALHHEPCALSLP